MLIGPPAVTLSFTRQANVHLPFMSTVRTGVGLVGSSSTAPLQSTSQRKVSGLPLGS